jgi:hypothetical protein
MLNRENLNDTTIIEYYNGMDTPLNLLAESDIDDMKAQK